MKLPDLSYGVSRAACWIAVAILGATFFLNPEGYGFSMCAFKNATGLDCFGCGMTRGVTSITHLRFGLAWRHHPFAYFFWPLMIVLALGAIPPVGRRMAQLVRTHRRRVNVTLWVATLLFVAFGFARMFAPGFYL